MFLAPDPIIADLKFALKLKYRLTHGGLYFSIVYEKVKILLLCSSLTIFCINKRKNVSIFFLAFLIPIPKLMLSDVCRNRKTQEQLHESMDFC